MYNLCLQFFGIFCGYIVSSKSSTRREWGSVRWFLPMPASDCVLRTIRRPTVGYLSPFNLPSLPGLPAFHYLFRDLVHIWLGPKSSWL